MSAVIRSELRQPSRECGQRGGHEFEHSFGHGKRYRPSLPAAMMPISLVDQIQGHARRVFKEARTTRETKATLWLQKRAMMATSVTQ